MSAHAPVAPAKKKKPEAPIETNIYAMLVLWISCVGLGLGFAALADWVGVDVSYDRATLWGAAVAGFLHWWNHPVQMLKVGIDRVDPLMWAYVGMVLATAGFAWGSKVPTSFWLWFWGIGIPIAEIIFTVLYWLGEPARKAKAEEAAKKAAAEKAVHDAAHGHH